MSAPKWFKREFGLGDSGGDVTIVQRKLMDEYSGTYTHDTAALVRGFQIARGLEVTGRVDEATAEQLGDVPGGDVTPEWFKRDLALWDNGDDVKVLRKMLGIDNGDDRFDPDLESLVRQFQSSQQIAPDGKVNESLAILLEQCHPL